MSGEDRSLVLDRNLVLAAGAGSGKTHALVTVALGLYAGAAGRAPIDPGRVWAVTFTEKAAAELRQRLADRALKLAHNGGDLSKEPDLEKALGERRPSAGDWERIARALSLAPIGTFHSLCAQLLRTFAAEARLDPRFAILDEREAGALFERAREEVLLELVAEEGAARRLVAELGGVGKVREAIDFLHGKLGEEGLDPRALLGSEAFDRVRAQARFGDACGLLSLALAGVSGSDHPRLQPAVETLARERTRIGRCAPEAIDRWYPAVAAVMACKPGNLPKAAREVWNEAKIGWERLQRAWASLRQASIAADLVEVLERVGAAYAAEKARAGGLDFSDLVRRTRDLLRDDPAVRREAKRRIAALLVDEFQDTNGVQLDLVRLLAEVRDEERVVPPGGSCSDLPLEPATFCAVGDRKQSIYEFRGADVALFADLTARAREGRELRLQALTRSWRSRPGLVEFANGLFATVLAPAGQPWEVGWFAAEDALAPQRVDGPVYAGLPAVQLLCGEPGLRAEDRRPWEARLVAAHVEALLSSGRQVEEKSGAVRPLVGADVAILLRSFEQAGLYQQALAQRGIPTLVVGGRNFYGAPEVRDLGALLLALCDPWDRFASAAVLRSPLGGLSDDALVLLEAQGKLELGRHGAGCTAALPARDAAALDRIGRLVRRLAREVDRLGPAAVLRHAIDALDLRTIWAAASNGEQRLANVEKLLRLLEERQGLGALAAAEEILARGEDPRDREAPADVAAFADSRAVRILTVHASKGLEFPVVVLPELGAGEKPDTSAVFFERERGLAVKPTDPLGDRLVDEHAQEVLDALASRRNAESRRLFYVAVTRARDLLVLCGEKGSRGAGTWRALLDEALPAVEALVERVTPPGAHVGTEGEAGADASAHVGTGGEAGADASAHVGTGGEAGARASAHVGTGGEAGADARAHVGTGEEAGARASAHVGTGGEAGARASAHVGTGGEAGADASAHVGTGGEAGADASAHVGTEGEAGARASAHVGTGSAAIDVEARQLLEQVAPVPIAPGRFVAAVTELAELLRCERRYFYKIIAGLEEHAGPGPLGEIAEADEADLPGIDRLARGQLAHRVLELVDHRRTTADAAAAVREVILGEGLDPAHPEVAAIAEDVVAFLEGPMGRELAALPAERVYRELPFALELRGEDGSSLALRGQIDLLYVGDDGAVRLVDYKHASGRGQAPDAYGFQLRTYALAASRILPGELPLQAGIAWLRDRGAAPRLVPIERSTLADHEARLAGLGTALTRARATGSWRKLAGPEACGDCGFARRCWGGRV